MKINNNISAIVTNKQLLGTESSLTAAMERLSSGYKLNHAADNPAGMAISNKMRAQIRGLDQASRNASDGTSVLDTVDGALSEVTSMIQRMRELCVQAANGVYTDSELDSLQSEVASLREEVDRIATSTEFNTKSLLNGSQDAQVYPESANINDVSRLEVSQSVPEGDYKLEVTEPATQAEMELAGVTVNSLVGTNGTLIINDYSISINEEMTADEIYTQLRNGAQRAECNIEIAATELGENLKFSSTEYGVHADISVKYSTSDDSFKSVMDAAGIPDATDENATAMVSTGSNAVITLNTNTDESLFDTTATTEYDGNKITITDKNNFKMTMYLTPDLAAGTEIGLNVTQVGVMDLQIGANEGQKMQIRIPDMTAEAMYLDRLDVSTKHGARNGMAVLDGALERVNMVRSQMGAYTNRLDYTVNSLDETEENMESAISRLMDADMAAEMSEYTKYNVIEQAATSALAQANEIPSLALQLLQ
ncbi:MAG: flagellin [Lachnospiraceae bacterium]|nr:flagellin [Lachnospiraceae bacterium]